MKEILQKLIRYLMLLFIVLIPINCATSEKKAVTQDMAKMEPTPAAEIEEPSFITSLTSEILDDRYRVYVKATRPIQYTAFKLTDPLRLILDIPDMQLNQEARKPIMLNKGAVNSISSQYFKESNISRIIVSLNQNVHYDISRTGVNELKIDIDFPEELQAEAEQQMIKKDASVVALAKNSIFEHAKEEPLPEESEIDEAETTTEEELESEKQGKEYTGQLISLDFQDANLKNVLRLIAEISKLNIITSPEVKGTVNLRLIDVPWDQALAIILRNNKLGCEGGVSPPCRSGEGNIVRIATLERLAADKQAEIEAEDMERASKKAKEKGEELIFSTIRISYATLEDIQSVLDGVKSERGEIKIDERTKTLILYDVQSKIEEMKDLIKILDERTPQVTIQARIVEVSTNFSREFGIQWGGTFNKTFDKVFPNTFQLRGGTPGGLSGGGGSNFVVDLPAAVGTGSGTALGLTLGSLTGAAILDVQLSALENSGDAKILASPKITTANHKEATIKSGRSIPYETVSSEGTQTQFVDAAISLRVTPHITPDGFILLEIEAKKNEADFGNTGASGAPTIITKEAKTEVLVKDGETTVLGGLYKSTRSKSDKGVPFLSKLPLIKWFFKNELKKIDTEELLIFITPTIVKQQEIL